MTVVLFGAGGQLGRAVQAIDPAVRALDRAACDVADPAAVASALAGASLAINAAAYTDVDRAESDIIGAWRGNVAGPANIAVACAVAGIPLIHISTDYVFDGHRTRPWRENDAPNPLSAYGQSKWEGEEAVRAALPRHIILRTAWVFSPTGRNFVKTMLNAARTRRELRVVDDRTGCPTAADDLAAAVLRLAQAALQPDAERWGTWHFAGQPPVSWYGFAQAIFADHPDPPQLTAIAGADWPAPAPRPDYAVLDCGRIKRDFGIAAPDWRAGLQRTLAALRAQEEKS